LQGKAMAYLQLMRFPNLFTAAADVVAGYLIVRGLDIKLWELVGLIVSTSGIYAGGCILNDLCDRRVDARERPSRPIPSGKVSSLEAFVLLCFCFGVGLLSALCVGNRSLFIAFIITSLAISYDTFTKERDLIGPLNMAACRFCNLILGMSPAISFVGVFLIFPFISMVYVFSLTCLSRFEVGGELAQRSWIVLGGWILVLAAVSALTLSGHLMVDGIIFLGILTLYTVKPLIKGLLSPSPISIQRAVKALIIGIPLLDAVYSSGTHGLAFGIPVALCALPPPIISRYFYVT
jgi:4-hydroxybenzoate polyprenyltransferase